MGSINDSYLNMARDVYYGGTWSREEFIQAVDKYAKENGIDENIIVEFLREVFTKEQSKDYSIEEKRAFLAAVTFKDGTLKYAVQYLDDASVERFYAEESKNLGPVETEKLHNKVKGSVVQQADPNTYRIVGGEKTVIAPGRNPAQQQPRPQQSQQTAQQQAPQQPQQTARPAGASGSSQQRAPQTEEDYQRILRNLTGEEPDSTVRHVPASEERINRLKKKSKLTVKEFFLKGAVVGIGYLVLGPAELIGIVGYTVFSQMIEHNKWNPKTRFGQLTKNAIISVMNLGRREEDKIQKTDIIYNEEKGRSK